MVFSAVQAETSFRACEAFSGVFSFCASLFRPYYIGFSARARGRSAKEGVKPRSPTYSISGGVML